MIIFDATIVNSDTPINIDENVIGWSIEPAPGSNDGFTFGLYSDPIIHMDAGDSGRDFGFLSSAKAESGFEFCKEGEIKIRFDNVGATKGVLLIKTKYIC